MTQRHKAKPATSQATTTSTAPMKLLGRAPPSIHAAARARHSDNTGGGTHRTASHTIAGNRIKSSR